MRGNAFSWVHENGARASGVSLAVSIAFACKLVLSKLRLRPPPRMLRCCFGHDDDDDGDDEEAALDGEIERAQGKNSLAISISQLDYSLESSRGSAATTTTMH